MHNGVRDQTDDGHGDPYQDVVLIGGGQGKQAESCMVAVI